MEAETSSSSSKNRVRINNDYGFMDTILSWSIDDILNEELYKTQVDRIELSFKSVNNYIGSFVYPLLEETRAQLCSSMEVLQNAPFAKVNSIDNDKKFGRKFYNLNIGEWKNRFTLRTNEPYRILPGDVLILTDYKPETVNGLQRFARMWTFVSVVKTSEDEDLNLKVKVKASSDIDPELKYNKSLFLVFLTNISSNRRIWNALHMDGNLNIVNQVLTTSETAVAESCNCCSVSEMSRDDSSLERLLSNLNDYQKKAIHACLSGIRCSCTNNNSKIKLIWGPPGTGKTKTLATLLFALMKMKYRVLVCAPTNVAIKEIASRVVSIVKDSESGETFCSLGSFLLFGNNERLKVDGELVEEIYLDYRVQELTECFGSYKGLSSCLREMFHFLDGYELKRNYTGKFRGEFLSTALRLRRCISILFTHVNVDIVVYEKLYQNLVLLKKALDSFEDLLFQNGEYQSLCKERNECLEALKVARDSLVRFPFTKSFKDKAIRESCLQNASLLFCTVSGSYNLHSVAMKPLDILVIDEAAQLKECESLIAMKIEGIRHAILLGDECQLPSVVESTVSREVGFGRSLFERLSISGHPKQLLSMQHRMHPKISSFPNSYFYFNKILDAPNVQRIEYNKKYLPGKIFGPYSFINVAGGREEYDAAGRSRKNVAEVAVVTTIVKNLHKSWLAKREKLCIGIVSPYVAQVAAIQEKIGKIYDNDVEFTVNVKSIDGFQGGEQDVIILSTVRTNNRTPLDFVSSQQRTNVALTRARHCLWILGNERALSYNENVWKHIISDVKKRNCFFNAEEDEEFSKAILDARKDMDQFDDLLMTNSILFRNSRWKVNFSDKFLRSFKSLPSEHSKKLVINLLERLSNGLRPNKTRVQSLSNDSSEILKSFKIESRYLIFSIEIVRYSSYMQVLKIWDILPPNDLHKLAKRLGNVFATYTEDYISRCKEKGFYRQIEIPLTWPLSRNIQKLKNADNNKGNEGEKLVSVCEDRNEAEMSKFKEWLLLMKYCSNSDHEAIDLDLLPISLTEEQRRVIFYPRSTFLLGRFGTGKTTVLTTKMIRNQKLHHSAVELVYERSASALENCDKSQEICAETERPVLRQLFVTLSPELCQEVKCHVSRFERFVGTSEASSSSVKDIHLPDSFLNVQFSSYPLVVTFRKFLMMLDLSLGRSYFERFKVAKNSSLGQGLVPWEAFLATKEVTYEKFDSSYWPHFNAQKIKNLGSYQVFTEIMTHIKGGIEATNTGKMSRKDYLTLSESRRSSLSGPKRDLIYDTFENYENMKMSKGEFDMADFVSDLHRRLRSSRYQGDLMHFVYIDEVQDLTMSQIALFKHICPNVEEGFIFCGDTAQTIGRGIDFRFQDVRALFYNKFTLESNKEKGLISDMFMLSENFRSKAEVLKLAQSIVELLFHFFPYSVDILKVETSLITGEAPYILLGNWIETIFGENGYKNVEFGANQAIVVRDNETREKILPLVGKKALVLTILECKGLEFEDVLLYNFLSTSPLKRQWGVIYQFMKEKHVFCASFDETKHNVLCSELKQLYVAVTRSKNRLWICEDKEEFSRPMIDYWKKKSLVQFMNQPNEAYYSMQSGIKEYFLEAMKNYSTNSHEWMERGIKLYNQNNYSMATMCFERAGDDYWLKKCKHAALIAM
ncbi:uncharacterized protein LOC107626920 [Arachis ipaensis]|uniref:uncharacterized protein LOC107626920 n=1 Tax=Arachis ipaensis TaxID=130454 RepID=UPI0007AF44C3|nr:uncharacterized protein LOC107626920 [Arachis ipaensis]